MSLKRPKQVEPISMGNTYAPLNSTVPNLSLSSANGGTADRNVLDVAAAVTISMDTACGTIEFKPMFAPSSPIYIKWGTPASQTVATATVWDEVITEANAQGLQR